MLHKLISSEIMGSHTQAVRVFVRSFACVCACVCVRVCVLVIRWKRPGSRVTCLCVNDKREFNGEPISFCGDGHRPKTAAQVSPEANGPL